MNGIDEGLGDAGDPRDAEENLGAVWRSVSEELRDSLPDSTYRIWLEPLRPAGVRGQTLYLRAPDGVRTWVERRYATLIASALERVGSDLRQVSFATPEQLDPGSGSVNPQYTFSRFVIGEGNRVAHAAALAVAEAPAEAYNPLFLHGPPGLGKSHLLGAIANYLADNASELTVRYTTAESFTNEFVGSLRGGAGEFKQRYREIDVLLIDDVQFLEGKRHTEEEFFHTFNALHDAGSQVVLSADRIPSELSTLAERLRDRFEWGLTVAVEPPNLATRLTVLRRLAGEANLEVADAALSELARRIDLNVRQLHGALTRVVAQASLLARPLSDDLVAEVIPARNEDEVGPASRIQAQVAAAFGVPVEELIGPGRGRLQLRARQVGILLTREQTALSLAEIGRAFGGRDHSTVLNSLRRIEAAIGGDQALARQVEQIRREIHSHSAPGG